MARPLIVLLSAAAVLAALAFVVTGALCGASSVEVRSGDESPAAPRCVAAISPLAIPLVGIAFVGAFAALRGRPGWALGLGALVLVISLAAAFSAGIFGLATGALLLGAGWLATTASRQAFGGLRWSPPMLLAGGLALLLLAAPFASYVGDHRFVGGASFGAGSGSVWFSPGLAQRSCPIGSRASFPPDGQHSLLVGSCLHQVELVTSRVHVALASDRPVTIAVMSAADFAGWALGGPLNTSFVLRANVTQADFSWDVPVWDLFWPKPYDSLGIPPALQTFEERLHVSSLHGVLVVLPGAVPPDAFSVEVRQDDPSTAVAEGLTRVLLLAGALLVLAGAWLLRRDFPHGPGASSARRLPPDAVQDLQRRLVYRQRLPLLAGLLLVVAASAALFRYGSEAGLARAAQSPFPALDSIGALLGVVALIGGWAALVRWTERELASVDAMGLKPEDHELPDR